MNGPTLAAWLLLATGISFSAGFLVDRRLRRLSRRRAPRMAPPPDPAAAQRAADTSGKRPFRFAPIGMRADPTLVADGHYSCVDCHATMLPADSWIVDYGGSHVVAPLCRADHDRRMDDGAGA